MKRRDIVDHLVDFILGRPGAFARGHDHFQLLDNDAFEFQKLVFIGGINFLAARATDVERDLPLGLQMIFDPHHNVVRQRAIDSRAARHNFRAVLPILLTYTTGHDVKGRKRLPKRWHVALRALPVAADSRALAKPCREPALWRPRTTSAHVTCVASGMPRPGGIGGAGSPRRMSFPHLQTSTMRVGRYLRQRCQSPWRIVIHPILRREAIARGLGGGSRRRAPDRWPRLAAMTAAIELHP